MPKHGIIFFDSDCIMCDTFVQWIAKRDKKKYFYYSSGNILKTDTKDFTQSETITQIKTLNQKTILYLENSKLYQKSNAIQQILFHMNFFYYIFGLSFYLFPKKFRDIIYDFISKNRKCFFKTKKLCSLEEGSKVQERLLAKIEDINRISKTDLFKL